MKLIKPGENPRVTLKHHKERGPRRHYITFANIAAICGMTEGSVRNAACKRGGKPPRLDMSDLQSLVNFIVARQRR